MITVTDACFDKVAELINDTIADGTEVAALRIAIQGGGCSGFQYAFQWAEEIAEDDEVLKNDDGITIVVDPMSMMYLDGASIDYVKSLQGEQFAIKNPNATTQCGCGSSFGA